MPRVLPLSSLIVVLAACVLAFTPLQASAKPHLTSCDPRSPAPRASVHLSGRGLDPEHIHNPSLRWGQGDRTLGSIAGVGGGGRHPGLFLVASHPAGTVIGGPGHGEVHFKLPVTDNVNRLIREAQHISAEPSRHVSFLLSAEKLDEWHDDPNPTQCLGRYRNFVLEVKW